MNIKKQFREGLITNNPVLVQQIGMCATMAITTSLFNGVGMGLSVLIILTCCNVVISAIRKIIPDEIRLAIFVVVIAGFVTIVDLLLQAFIPALSDALGVKNDLPLSDYMNMPDVLTVEASEEDQDAVRALFMRALNLALDDLTAMRKREGNSLRGDMMKKLDAIDGLRESIATRAPTVVEEYRAKLSQRLSALLSGDIDEARFATEVAIFADRAAIDEELVRLSSHIAQLRATAELDEPVGRKLDFLVQELNREVNTIGSKASDAQIAGCVVAAKGEIEKLREQVQNIE